MGEVFLKRVKRKKLLIDELKKLEKLKIQKKDKIYKQDFTIFYIHWFIILYTKNYKRYFKNNSHIDWLIF
jgi:hypothetical protein